jgi:hypothetical protein
MHYQMADETAPRSPQTPVAVSQRVLPEPLVAALRDPTTQRLYANGFTIGFSNADAHIVLQLFGRPIAVWNLSYTLAKTLAKQLTQLIATWEQATQHRIATTDEVDLAFKHTGDPQ